jgi:hypothetical protein
MNEISYEDILLTYQKVKEGVMDGRFGMTTEQVEEEQVKCASLLENMSN